MDPEQRELWAQELQKADNRCLQFKEQLDQYQQQNAVLNNQIRELEAKVMTRDQEIRRMQMQYQGGDSFQNIKQVSDIDRISQERQKMIENFEDMANLLDITDFRFDGGAGPVNFQLINNVFQNVENMKQKLEDAKQDKMQMNEQI